MKKFIVWSILWIWWLFIAWQIYISHDSLIDILFKTFYYSLNLLVIISFVFLINILTTIFWEKEYFWNEKKIINIKTIVIFILWIFFIGFILDKIQSEENKARIYSFAENISSYIKIEEWKMPIFYFWDIPIKEEINTWTYLSNPKK